MRHRRGKMRFSQTGLGASYLGILLEREGLHRIPRGQRRQGGEIVDNGEALIEVRKKEHDEHKARLIGGKFDIFEVARSRFELQLSFHDVNMGDVAGSLLFLRDVHKALGFLEGLGSIDDFALGGDETVIILDNRKNKTTRGNFLLSERDGLGRLSLPGLAAPDESKKILAYDGLFVINMHAIIRDEDSGRSAVPFGIQELVEGIHGG